MDADEMYFLEMLRRPKLPIRRPNRGIVVDTSVIEEPDIPVDTTYFDARRENYQYLNNLGHPETNNLPVAITDNSTEVVDTRLFGNSTKENTDDDGTQNSSNLMQYLSQKVINPTQILCNDISFGLEHVPVPCIGHDGLHDMPWSNFCYITKSIIHDARVPKFEDFQVGCACLNSNCNPLSCTHVYVFDADYINANDIYGKPMRGKLPYDENGRVILEEGYPIFECNDNCKCSRDCYNRVLQNGPRVKLELFETDKGWIVRAGEPILRGTFICEYIGEISKEQGKMREDDGCFKYKIVADSNHIGKKTGSQITYFINATRYGNVARFINHSNSSNLVTYQVVVENLDPSHVHIGFYARRDIAIGEELTYAYDCDIGSVGQAKPEEGTSMLKEDMTKRPRAQPKWMADFVR